MRDAASRITSSRTRAYVALFFFAALALRAFFFLQARDLEFFQVLGLDAQFYHDWARRIARSAPEVSEPFFQGPLYPYFLGLLYKVFGPQVIVAQLAQLVLGAISTALVFVVGERAFSRPAGVLAAILWGCYGYAMFLESHLVAAPLLTFVFLVFVVVGIEATRRESLRWWLGAGVLLGVLATGRGVFAALPVWMLVMVLASRRDAARGRKLRSVGLLTVGALLGLLPLTLHNVVRGGELVLLTTNGGINYYIGNHDGATGAFDEIEGVHFFQPGSGQDGGSRALAESRAGRSLSAGAASRYWLGEGLRWNLQHPGRTLLLWVKKFWLVASDYEIPQIENYGWAKDQLEFLRLDPVRWGWMFALAVIGVVVTWGSSPVAAWLTIVLTGCVVSLLPFFVTARFRVVMAPLVAVFAAQAALFLVRGVRARRMRPVAWGLSAFVALTVAFHLYAPAGIRAASDMLRDYSRGVVAMQTGDFEQALRHFARAAAQNDRHAPTLANMAFCLAQTGQSAKAVILYQEAIVLDPAEEPRLRPFLIQAMVASGDAAGAIERLRATIAAHADDLDAYATLGDLYLSTGDQENGRRMWSYVEQNAADPQLKAAARERLAGP